MRPTWFFKKKTIETQESRKIPKDVKSKIVKAINLISAAGASRGDYEEPEYELDEIKKAADADSYVKMALMKYKYLIYKAGYTLKADNDTAVNYIKSRFKVMSYATNKPMDILFQEIADDMVKYSNAFLIKSRVDSIGFNIKATPVGDNSKVVGGYFRADPTHIRIKRDKHGAILSYEQWSDAGETKTFKTADVVHFYMDKDAEKAYGTPRLIAALEDVKLLRRIEGNVISLIYRYAIPLYHWIVGSDQPGQGGSQTEIDDAKLEVENMALDGVVFTNERNKINVLGAEGNALDATNYLAYFENRVFAALGVSPAQMGRGGAKQDADSMEGQVHDTVKYIQRIIRIFTENFIIAELLMEGGFNPIVNESDMVSYEFEEINLETKIKVENHEMLKYTQNMNTFEEARTHMGMKSAEVDTERLYSNLITKNVANEQNNNQTKNAIKLADANFKNQVKLTKLSQSEEANSDESQEEIKDTTTQKKQTKKAINSKTGGKAGNNGTVAATSNKEIATKNAPVNQHGVYSVHVKEALNKEEHKKKYNELYKKYEALRNDIAEEKSDIDILIPLAKDGMLSEIKIQIGSSSKQGIEKAIQDIKGSSNDFIENITVSTSMFVEEADKTLTALLKDIKQRINESDTEIKKKEIFNTLEYRLRYLIENDLPKVYWYSYVRAGAELGEKFAYIDFDGSEDKKTHPARISTNNFKLEDIPAYHPFCDCKVNFKKKKG